MQMRKIKYLLPLVLSVCCLAGCKDDNSDNNGGDNGSEISKTEGYYADYDLDLENAFLATELQKMCFEKHKNYIPYSQYNSYCSKTSSGRNSIEAVADGSRTNQWFYTGKEATGYGTREHVWPCANSAALWTHSGSSTKDAHNVDYSAYIGGGSDLYHVRTAATKVNTARGNSKFVDFDDDEFADSRKDIIEISENNGKYILKTLGCDWNEKSKAYEYADKAEPADQMKGDVARIIVYVWVHYGSRGYVPEGSVKNGGMTFKKSDMCGSLSLTNIMGYESLDKCAQKLVEWNEIDPPSEVEKLRNTTVQKIQGNRNPFVDFPELMEQLFDQYLD